MGELALTGGPGGQWIEAMRRIGKLHADIETFPDFGRIERRATGNDALVCHDSHCGSAKLDFDAPVFDIAAAELKARIRAVALGEPRTIVRREMADDADIEFQQASALFRYPDIISVKLLALGERQSSIAIWSRSVVGRKDFGVNRARVERWLAALRPGT